MEQELYNPHPRCPECGYETYTEGCDEECYNVWCTNEECDWFAEVDIEVAQENCKHVAGQHFQDTCEICGLEFI